MSKKKLCLEELIEYLNNSDEDLDDNDSIEMNGNDEEENNIIVFPECKYLYNINVFKIHVYFNY